MGSQALFKYNFTVDANYSIEFHNTKEIYSIANQPFFVSDNMFLWFSKAALAVVRSKQHEQPNQIPLIGDGYEHQTMM